MLSNKTKHFFYDTNKPKTTINYDKKNDRFYDLIQYELDKNIYYFGDNFNNHKEIKTNIGKQVKVNTRILLIHVFNFVKMFQKNSGKSKKIWSSTYIDVSDKFKNTGLEIGSTPWQIKFGTSPIYNYTLYRQTRNLQKKLAFSNSNQLTNDSFFAEIEKYEMSLKKYIIDNKIQAIFLPHTIGFFEKLVVNIFKELGRPTFLFIHGLPYYWKTTDNRADYFVVWGPAIKKNYIDSGYAENKIIVSGHPLYKLSEHNNLKFNLENVLIITKSMNGIPFYDEYTLRDRSNCIVYMNMIQFVLKSLGVSKARFRPHPSENVDWYLKFIDKDFFTIDTNKLSASLNLSTVVIGPTSTVFLESLLLGINYVVFEPTLANGYTFDNCKAVKPFDGTDSRLPCAKNIDELFKILSDRMIVDPAIISDYCSDEFNIKIIEDIIKKA
jgi:hypothetical protein